MGMRKVTVGMTAQVELLEQSGNALPLGPLVSLLKETPRKLRSTIGRGERMQSSNGSSPHHQRFCLSARFQEARK